MLKNDPVSMVKVGLDPPEEVYVIIEIPKGSCIKYEYDPSIGLVFVDRKLSTPMAYPGNYGFIPQTSTERGDPVDALLLFEEPLVPLCVVACRPIGVLLSKDQDGNDPKIIVVPAAKIDPTLSTIRDLADIDESILSRIKYFIEHHKDLEEGKFVQFLGWEGREGAMKVITDAMDAYAKR